MKVFGGGLEPEVETRSDCKEIGMRCFFCCCFCFFFSWHDGKFLKLDCGDDFTTL